MYGGVIICGSDQLLALISDRLAENSLNYKCTETDPEQ